MVEREKKNAFQIFATPFFSCENCNLDIKKLEKECLDFMDKTPSANFSNVGGYQGQDFENEDLSNSLAGIKKDVNSKL